METEVRACRADEFRIFYETCEAAFGVDVRDEDAERLRRIISTDDLLAAFHGDAMVGTAGAFRFALTVPGGEVEAAGVTAVGVLPSHRRRGVLTKLMRAQLERVHADGQPVAILWASEGSIYGRFGYGLATRQASIDIERDRAVFADRSPGEGTCRLLGVAEAAKTLPDVYERARTTTPGMFARSPEWWEVEVLADPEHARRGGGPMWRAVWEHEGRAEAYALYRVQGDWQEGVPAGSLEVLEAIGTTPRGTREIWRFLFGVDLVARVRCWFLPLDHPLFLLVAEPRRLRFTLKDGLWLRVVDLPAALRARSYACGGSLVLEVSDELCPWNAGRWALACDEDGARVERTGDDADLALGAAELGACYLGGVGFGELLRAGRVRELSAGATRRAAAMFATERAPWCPETF